ATSPAAQLPPSPAAPSAAPGRPQAPHHDPAPLAGAPAAAAPSPAAGAGAGAGARAAVGPKAGFYYSIKLSPFKPLSSAPLPPQACLQLVPDDSEHRLLPCPFLRAPLHTPLAELAQLVGLRLGVPPASI